MNQYSDSTPQSQDNNRITPLFGEFIGVPYNQEEAPYFQQFDGEEWFNQDFLSLNSDADVVRFINQELDDYANLCVRLIDGYWHVCTFDWGSNTLAPLMPSFNRAGAYINAIALMSRSEQYRAEADEPLPFEIEYEKQRMADWNATVRASLGVVEKTDAEQGGVE